MYVIKYVPAFVYMYLMILSQFGYKKNQPCINTYIILVYKLIIFLLIYFYDIISIYKFKQY